jgi:DNA polymerase III delta subunit
MLTIVCGEDSKASRNYFSNLKKNAKEKDYEVYEIDPKNLGEILNWLSDAPSLFAAKKVFFTQSLNKNNTKKTNTKNYETYENNNNHK